jgi:hypothetical protein
VRLRGKIRRRRDAMEKALNDENSGKLFDAFVAACLP